MFDFRDRDASFSVDLPSTDKGADPIVEMVKLNNRLYLVRQFSIWEVLTADTIDPHRHFPDAPHHAKMLFSFGTTDPVVARTLIQTKRLSEFLLSERSEPLIQNALRAMRNLANARHTFRQLLKDVTKTIQECDDAITKNGKSMTIVPFPQVPNLEEMIHYILISTKRALIDFHVIPTIILSMPACEAKFHKAMKWMIEQYGVADRLAAMLQENQAWLKVIGTARNAAEHNSETEMFEVVDFELLPQRKFMPPICRYQFKGMATPTIVELVPQMSNFIDKTLEFGEDMLLLSLEKIIPTGIPIAYYRIADDKINASCPVRYSYGLDAQT